MTRVLHAKTEFAELQSRASIEEQAKYLASRWAYKEATVKATGNR